MSLVKSKKIFQQSSFNCEYFNFLFFNWCLYCINFNLIALEIYLNIDTAPSMLMKIGKEKNYLCVIRDSVSFHAAPRNEAIFVACFHKKATY